MKIAQIVSDFPLANESPYLGPANVVYNLVLGLKNIDSSLSIDIITVKNDISKYFSSQILPGVTVHYLPRIKYLTRSIGDPLIIKKILGSNNYDIIHSHSSYALTCCMRLNTPKILTIHSIFHEEKKYEKSKIVKVGYYDLNSFLFKKIISKVDAFIAISPYVIDELKTLNIYNNVKYIAQINNPVDISFFHTRSNNHEDNIIFYPAVLNQRKNQLAAINAIELVSMKVSNIKLVLTGGNDTKYLQKIEEEIKKRNLSNYVEYLGKVPRCKLFDLYNKASIVYLLSKQETQPMTILEAMSTGNSVIASNINSNRYLVKTGVNGYLVDPDDSAMIAKYTIEMLNNKEGRQKMGENAREMALNNYHPDAIATQTLNLYKKIISGYD